MAKSDCFASLLQEAGPDRVLQAMQELVIAGRVSQAADTHQVAHAVGRQTARVYGLNGEAFLRCSTEFNYGCQHGFFEQALIDSPSATEAATRICADLAASHPSKTVFYCYHGVGHGVMMASAYDLDRALGVCDAMGEATASEGCWQGVFMENVNAVMRGSAREGVFSDADPLAPCNRVAERHQWECYINHAGRLITLFDFSIGKASEACLRASEPFVPACIQSLGLMVTNPAWQQTLGGSGNEGRDVEVALELCGQFPDAYRQECVVGAVDNVMNFDGVVLDRALRLCGAADESYQEQCYRHIGIGIGVLVVDMEQREALCRQVDGLHRQACLEGAGIGSAGERQVTQTAPIKTALWPEPAMEGTPEVFDVEAEVRYEDGGFIPESVTIQVGQAVLWINGDSEAMWPASDVHPTHQEYLGFDAGRPIAVGGSYTFAFTKPGTWSYHNHMNPKATGVVVVVDKR